MACMRNLPCPEVVGFAASRVLLLLQAGPSGGNARRAAASIDLERRLSGSKRLSISTSDLEPVYHSKERIETRRAAARSVCPLLP